MTTIGSSSISSSSSPHASSLETWVSSTCELLTDNSWNQDRPLCVDMSTGWSPELREAGFVSILQALSRTKSVRTLKLKNVSAISMESSSRLQKALLALLTTNTSIRSMSIDSMPLPADLLWDMTNLDELVIERCKIDETGAAALAHIIRKTQNRHALTVLKLVNVSFDHQGLEAFADALVDIGSSSEQGSVGGGLETLEISNTRLSEDQRIVLLKALAAGNNSLTSISLDNMNLGLAEAPHLAAILRHNQQLTTLSLRENNLNGESIKIIVTEQGLLHNSSLRFLSLAFNPVGDDGAMHLSECLTKQKNHLHVLDLEFAEIWHKGCLVLAKSLSQIVGLQRLELDGNELEDCAGEMLTSVMANMTVAHVSGIFALSFGDDDDDDSSSSAQTTQWKKVEYFLRLNRANRRILTSPTMELSLWPHVLEHANNDVDVLYHMLTQAPYIVGQAGKDSPS